MHVTRYKRQAFLFLAAILVPAAVLVGLATVYELRSLENFIPPAPKP